MIYKILATGSDGNAVILNGNVLVDIGVPYKTIEPYAKDLRLVFLTHAHGDHFNAATVKRLAYDRPAIRFVCCFWMVQHLLETGVKMSQIDVVQPDAWSAWTLNETVYASPVKLSHNVPNCGWRFWFEQGHGEDPTTIFYATDTGTLDGISVKDYDLYLVEANHVRADLERRLAEKESAGEFAYERRAAENHLSYEQACDWLTENMASYSLWVPMHGHKEKEAVVSAGTPDACEIHN